MVAALLSNRTLLPPHQLHGDHARTARWAPLLTGWTGRLLLLGAVAFVFTLAEGSALDWSAVLLADHRGADPALAAAGLAVFQSAVTLGRLLGDRMVDRVGLGYLGSFTGPALIGYLAQHSSLPTALLVPALAVALTAAAAPAVRLPSQDG